MKNLNLEIGGTEMAKNELSLSQLRKIRVDYDGYFRPLVPRVLLQLLGANGPGEVYQWDLENVNGIDKITLEFKPNKMPTILSILRNRGTEK